MTVEVPCDSYRCCKVHSTIEPWGWRFIWCYF